MSKSALPGIDQKLLSIDQVCKFLDLSKQSLWRMIRLGKFPAGIKFGRQQKWLADTVKDHILKMSEQANSA